MHCLGRLSAQTLPQWLAKPGAGPGKQPTGKVSAARCGMQCLMRPNSTQFSGACHPVFSSSVDGVYALWGEGKFEPLHPSTSFSLFCGLRWGPLRVCPAALFIDSVFGTLMLLLGACCRRFHFLLVVLGWSSLMHDSNFLQCEVLLGQRLTSRARRPPSTSSCLLRVGMVWNLPPCEVFSSRCRQERPGTRD